ncbi:MAG: ribonuclease Z [Prevotellaceae bacterium]|jgi:ribonuclease Z|nr:ribonuclease Z [Prevotellaceae bacterium]
MQNPTLTILGAGSALPTRTNFPAAYLLEMRDKQFLIDCGEGAQIRMRQMNLKTNRLGHIFISHLHGDHCFGLIGLISSFGMLGRTAQLHIHAPEPLETLLRPLLNFFCENAPFDVIFHHFDTKKSAQIFEDKSVTVTTIPLKHRVPCCGFLFEEKPRLRNIKREMIDFYQIPIANIPKIKQGDDFVSNSGEIVPNDQLTTPAPPPRRFAYCSDTAFAEKIIPLVHNVDLLVHEATFAEEESARARETKHSTARQAAEIAQQANVKKLLICHLSARYHENQNRILQEANAVFANTVLGKDGITVEF